MSVGERKPGKRWVTLQALALTALLALIFGIGVTASGTFAAAPTTVPMLGEGSNNTQRATSQTAKPLESLLNDDGTLNLRSGFSGSLDPTGWSMTTGPNEQPRFVKAGEQRQQAVAKPHSATSSPMAPGDENWDDRFNTLGMNSTVRAIAISGSNVYVGGDFTQAGGVFANRIARWDGNNWSALGSGLNDRPYAIAISGSDVYVGGQFTIAGGCNPCNHIAKWDGSTWSALGSGVVSGLNNFVFAIAISGSDVYVGGNFTQAGGQPANYIAVWNGSTWSAALSTGINNDVTAIAISGSDVYVGGGFTTAGSVSANRIAKWNGSTWSALGNGMDGRVQAIAISGTDVYVGGAFTTAGSVSANRIARWDGSTWFALGSGLSGTPIATLAIYAIAISGSDVYAGGDFTQAGGVFANRIAKWDGSAWSALGSGVNNIVNALAINGSDVYVGGAFTTAGVNPSYDFGIWHTPSAATPTGTPPTATNTSTITNTPTPIATSCPNLTWTQQAAYPINVLDQAAATQGGILYSFSGISNGGWTANSYKYDPNTNTWSAIASLPLAREVPAAVSDGTYIYILGGALSNGPLTNTMSRYDPATNTYTSMASYNIATWTQGAAYLNGKIYRIAGCTDNNCNGGTNTVEVYNIFTNSWTFAASYPLSTGWIMAVAYNGYIYAAGGLSNGTAQLKTYRYDPNTNAWDDASIADLPATRWGAASDILNGRWMLAGGEVSGAISSSAISWDPGTNTWSALASMPAARSRMRGGTLGQAFHVIGGRVTTGFTGSTDNQRALDQCPGAPTPTRTSTSTPTNTPTSSLTVTSTPTNTPIPTDTDTPTVTPTFTHTPLPTDTPTDTPTDMPTFTYTPIPTDTPTDTPTTTPTSTPAIVNLVGHVTWAGSTQPNSRQMQPLTLTLCSTAGGPTSTYPATTDASGYFTVNVASLIPGNYNWREKGYRALANGGTMTLTGSDQQLEMGAQRGGDANNDNVVNVGDFNILKSTFQSTTDLRADFNNDGVISSQDFNILKNNFSLAGAPVTCP